MSGRIRCLPRGSAERVRILRNGSTGLPTAATALPADPPHATGTARHPPQPPIALPQRPPVGVLHRRKSGQRLARTVPQAVPRFQREASSVGPLLGQYCNASRVLEGKPRPWGGRGRGLQAMSYFQSDTTLCKRYNTCKAWYRCTSGGISVKAAPLFHRCEMRPGAVVGQRRRLHGALRVQRDASGQETTHWGRACAGGTGAEGGIGVGNHLLGQVISLPQWPVACPNAPLPAPMRFHTRQVPVEGCRPAPRRDRPPGQARGFRGRRRPAPRRDRPPRRDRGPGRRAPPWPAQPAFS